MDVVLGFVVFGPPSPDFTLSDFAPVGVFFVLEGVGWVIRRLPRAGTSPALPSGNASSRPGGPDFTVVLKRGMGLFTARRR